jgi:hypothetical protein
MKRIDNMLMNVKLKSVSLTVVVVVVVVIVVVVVVVGKQFILTLSDPTSDLIRQ